MLKRLINSKEKLFESCIQQNDEHPDTIKLKFKYNENGDVITKFYNEETKLEIDNKTSIVTLTHDPKLDDPALIFSLNSNALYIGCLGSKKTHEARVKRLEKKGFSKKEINKIYGPIGLNIIAKTPAEIACSIISQIVLRKNQNDF